MNFVKAVWKLKFPGRELKSDSELNNEISILWFVLEYVLVLEMIFDRWDYSRNMAKYIIDKESFNIIQIWPYFGLQKAFAAELQRIYTSQHKPAILIGFIWDWCWFSNGKEFDQIYRHLAVIIINL